MYLKSDVLLLAYVFENFRKMCLEIYEFISATRLVQQAVLKKTEAELDLLTDINMLLMNEKGY